MKPDIFESLAEEFKKKMEKKRNEIEKSIKMKDIGRKGVHQFKCENFTYL